MQLVGDTRERGIQILLPRQLEVPAAGAVGQFSQARIGLDDFGPAAPGQAAEGRGPREGKPEPLDIGQPDRVDHDFVVLGSANHVVQLDENLAAPGVVVAVAEQQDHAPARFPQQRGDAAVDRRPHR